MKIYIAVIVCWMALITVLADVSLTVFPSSDVEVNQVVSFRCLLNPNPSLPIIVRFFIDENLICTAEPGMGKCKNECPPYNVSCTSGTMFELQVSVPFDWSGKSVICKNLGNDSNRVKISVKVPVETVTLETPMSIILAGQQMNFTCTTSYCNPSAKISWNMSMTDKTSQSTYITTNNSVGLVRTTSFLQIQANKSNNGEQVFCTARNIPGQKVDSQRYSMNVYYPPSSTPAIFPSSTGLSYINGTTVNITCQLFGGNPLANLTFKCVGKSLKELNNSSSTTAKSVLIFEIDESFNNRTCTCTGQHLALGKDIQNNVTLTVNVSVTSVDLTLDQTAVNVNQQIHLTCITNYCNPAASITWYKGSSVIMSKAIATFDRDSNYLTRTTSVLTYTGEKEDNMKRVYCTATNLINAMNSTMHYLDVRYPPTSYPVISTSTSNFEFDDGTSVTLTCQLNGGNPLATLEFECNKLRGTDDNVGNETAVSVLSVVVDKSYNNRQCSCFAKHQLFNDSRSETKTLTVFYNNIIVSRFEKIYKTNESQRFQLGCTVDGNPLSNFTWIFVRNSSVIKTEVNKNMSLLEIDSANCLDFGQYTVLAENRKGSKASQTTTLAVNCKPRQYPDDLETSDKLGVGNNQSLHISTRILLYPNSDYVQWSFTRKVDDSRIISNNSMGFTIKVVRGESEENITLSKENVFKEDFGNYTVIVRNAIGEFKRKYQVISARSPLPPLNLTLVCDNPFSITLTWVADFNGGNKQTFQVFFSSGENNSSFKELKTVDDEGFGQIHSYSPAEDLYGHLRFRITASNKFGNSTTDAILCFTKTQDESSSDIATIAGIAAGGGLCLAFVVIVVVVYFRKYLKYEKSTKHIERLDNLNENKRDEADVDGLKENSLYVSAGPSNDEKSEVAVYAAVAKKLSQSDNNSNLYAEVKRSGGTDKKTMFSDDKPKKGLFKKDEKAKHKKGKKPKNRPGETDVYENSEDIALATNTENVYSNDGQKGPNKQKERGYKNKDGLLYVEVNFDGKQGHDNPVIHGEDEKTDYATVEFPMPSSVHKASGGEEL